MGEQSPEARRAAPGPEEATEAERQAVARQLAAIEARYGGRLDDAGRAVIQARLLEFHRLAATVRAAALSAADEPLPAFAPRRSGGVV
jgi:non-ribosomal peptide synthetase component F